MVDVRLDQIKRYEDKIRMLIESDENKKRCSYWKDDPNSNDYIWHPSPKDKSIIPFSLEIERIGYSRILNFSLTKFYLDPIEFVLRTLQCSIFKFETFSDCTPIGKSITYWPGVGFEASLFGMPQDYTEEDAWIGREVSIKDRIPLDYIEIPDFYNHPVMKETHRFYSRMQEAVSDDFTIVFPQWCRSPFGVAWHIRGVDAILIDYLDDFDWTFGFIDRLKEARFDFSKKRAEFLKTNFAPANLFNDEVTMPLVSPKMYKELIMPSEIAVSNYFGGINYWHSCGNTTALIPLINELPNVNLLHVSPWTDVWSAGRGYEKSKALEIALHPTEDVMFPASDDMLRKRITDIKEATTGFHTTVRADGFMVMTDAESDIKRLQHWVSEANKILLIGRP